MILQLDWAALYIKLDDRLMEYSAPEMQGPQLDNNEGGGQGDADGFWLANSTAWRCDCQAIDGDSVGDLSWLLLGDLLIVGTSI